PFVVPMPAELDPRPAAARQAVAPAAPITGVRRRAVLSALVVTLRRHGASSQAIVQALLAENAARCHPPLPRRALVRLAPAAAASRPCPPEFVAVPLLGLAGSAAGTARELELKPDWREGPNLFAAVVGDPGSKKSPALRLARAPLDALIAREAAGFRRYLDQ